MTRQITYSFFFISDVFDARVQTTLVPSSCTLYKNTFELQLTNVSHHSHTHQTVDDNAIESIANGVD